MSRWLNGAVILKLNYVLLRGFRIIQVCSWAVDTYSGRMPWVQQPRVPSRVPCSTFAPEPVPIHLDANTIIAVDRQQDRERPPVLHSFLPLGSQGPKMQPGPGSLEMEAGRPFPLCPKTRCRWDMGAPVPGQDESWVLFCWLDTFLPGWERRAGQVSLWGLILWSVFMLKPQAPFVSSFQIHQSSLWEERAWRVSGRERRREEALLRRCPSRLLMGSMPAG